MIIPDLSSARIIFSDIDGTLLPVTGKDLTASAAIIDKLCKAGYEFVICTGRGTENTPAVLREVPGVRYLITANGALVVNKEDRRYLRERRVNAPLARKILHTLRQTEGHAFCYRNGVHYMDSYRPMEELPPNNAELREWMAGATFVDLSELVRDDDAVLDKFGFCSFSNEVKEKAYGVLGSSDFAHELVLSRSASWNIEINASGGSKGEAAAFLLQRLGFTPEQMIAAGDNLNDLSMLKLAGFSVAPENALPEVKAAVSMVVPDCAKNGVEQFFEALLRQND